MAASAEVRWGNTRVAITDDDVTDNNNSSSDIADVDLVIIDDGLGCGGGGTIGATVPSSDTADGFGYGVNVSQDFVPPRGTIVALPPILGF